MRATLIALVALLAACSDDASSGADAAACSCPAAEPPLTDRIIRLPASGDIPANGFGGAGRGCPSGATLLGGSCRLRSTLRGIYLVESGVGDGAPGWTCMWESNAGLPATGLAEVICLLPAP